MTNSVDIATAAKLMDKTERHIRRMCISGYLRGASKQNSVWMIPLTAHPRLSSAANAHPEQIEAMGAVSADKMQKALNKVGIINQFEKFASEIMAGSPNIGRKQAMDIFAKQKNLHPATLYRWLSCYRTAGIQGLIDDRGRSAGHNILSPEAAERFKSLFLDQRKLSVKQCHQMISYENKKNEYGWQIPSVRSMYNWVDANIPQPVQILFREGKQAYDAKCAPYVQPDLESVEPNQIWVGDHHQFNCWIRHRNQWVRPWITAWQDKRSRAIVGWDIHTNPNQTTILKATRKAIDSFGPPEMVKIDNGKDYDSEMWTGTTKAKRKALIRGYLDEQMVAGIYGMMGVSVSFSIPYHPQSKVIERFFDTLDIQFTNTIDTYCGKDSARKPEDLNDRLQSDKYIAEYGLSLEQFADMLNQYIAAYNNTPHSGVGMDGLTPNQIMAQRTSRRYIDRDVLDMLLCVWSGELKVGKNGIRFKNMLYGQYESSLLMHFGKTVRVSYNPDDMRQITVYNADNMQLICTAKQNQLIAYGDAVGEESLREAMANKNRALKVVKSYKPAARTAASNITRLAIDAAAEAAQSKPADNQPLGIRPVRTVFDSQVKDHLQGQMRQQLKKAAGAESLEHSKLDLTFDFSRKSSGKVRLGFFDGK